MDLSSISEFAEEYQDWMAGQGGLERGAWFDVSVGQLEPEPLLSVPPHTSIQSALTAMNAHDRSAVLVVSGERLLGMFCERDIVQRVLVAGLDLERTLVSEVMTRDLEVIPDTTSIAQALCSLVRSPHRHLPVVDTSGRPVAIVSMQRILQFVKEAFANEIVNAPPEPKSGVFAFEGG